MNDTRTELILAAGFLTRLHFPPVEYTDATMARATRWYSAIGLAIGIALAIILFALSTILPQAIAVLLTVAAGMVLTGALHEDGLADLADGLGGSQSRGRALEIMRDSRIGSYGALALGMTLTIKIAALALLPLPAAIATLIAGHALGRGAMVWLMRNLPYARTEGAASFMDDTPRGTDGILWAFAAIALLPLWITVSFSAAAYALLCTAILFYLISRRLMSRLNGYTGDSLGAAEQLTEVLIPLLILAWL